MYSGQYWNPLTHEDEDIADPADII